MFTKQHSSNMAISFSFKRHFFTYVDNREMLATPPM